MTKHKSKKKSKFGLAPGTAVFTGVQKMDNIEIFVTQYNEDSCHELKCNSIQELKQMLSNTNDKIWFTHRLPRDAAMLSIKLG